MLFKDEVYSWSSNKWLPLKDLGKCSTRRDVKIDLEQVIGPGGN